jgi:hypothetical protein
MESNLVLVNDWMLIPSQYHAASFTKSMPTVATM